MEDITEEQQYRLLADPANGYTAPMVLWRPLQRLAGGAGRVVMSACSSDARGETTDWRVLWLTETSLVYGAASKTQIGFWTATGRDQTCDHVEVWARGLRQIRSITASDLAVDRRRDEASWRWTEAYTVEFVDGAVLQLPLHPDHASGAEGVATSYELLAALTERI